MLLVVVCAGQFMVMLDVSIVNVALPAIQKDLGFSPSALQWVVTAYTLALGGFLLLGGRTGDLFGRRRMLLIGLAIFAGSSLLGALAENGPMLIGARALQGLGAAVLSPATLTIVTTSFTQRRERSIALGAWSAMSGIGGASGVLLGGVLTQFLSWRWIFFINLPIAGLTMIGARAVVSETPEHQMRKGLDLWGAVAVTGGLTAFVYAISSTADHAVLSTRTMVPLLGSICLLGAFVVREGRVSRTGREPLVPFRLFRSRAVAGANLTMFMLSAAIFSMWLFLTLYYQQVLGLTPLLAGVSFVPQTLAIVLGAQISSRLIPRLGARPPLLAGALIATGGLGLLATMSPGDSYWTVAFAGGTATGLGMGIAMTPLAFAATARVLPTEAGLASGLLNTSRVLGGSIGLAILDTIAVGRDHSVRAHLPPTDEAFRAAMVAGYSRAFVIAAAVALLGAATAFFIPTIRRSPPDPGGADGASGPDTVIAGALVSDAVVLHRAVPPQNSS